MKTPFAFRTLFVMTTVLAVWVLSNGCRAKKSINVNAGSNNKTASDATAPAPVGITVATGLSLGESKPLPAGALPVEGGQYYLMPLPKQGNEGTTTQGEFTHQYYTLDGKVAPYLANKGADSWTIGKGSLDTESMMYEAQTDAPKFNFKWDPASKSYTGVQQTWENNQWKADPNFLISTNSGKGNWTFQPNQQIWQNMSGTMLENPNVYASSYHTGGATAGVAALQRPPVMKFTGYGPINQQLQKPGFAGNSYYNQNVYSTAYTSRNQYQYVPQNTALDNLLAFIITPYTQPNQQRQ